MSAPDRSEPTDIEALLGAIARGWCHPDNAHKVMDEKLAEAIMDEVFPLFVQARDHAGYRLVPEGEWERARKELEISRRLIERHLGLVNDGLKADLAALSDPEVTDV